MSEERPTADDLHQGFTVEVVKRDQDVHSTEQEPIIGEIGTVRGDDPAGPEVKLKSGVVGHVQRIVHDE